MKNEDEIHVASFIHQCTDGVYRRGPLSFIKLLPAVFEDDSVV